MANRRTPTVANYGATVSGEDYANLVNTEVEELWARSGQWLDSVTGTNSLTATTTPTLDAYKKNQRWYLVPQNTNSGAMQINIDGKGLRDIKLANGSALVGGEFVAGVAQTLIDTGTNLRMMATVVSSVNVQTSIYSFSLANNTNGGTATGGSRQTYPLNTTVLNEITGASLITGGGDINKFNLPAGTYEAEAAADFVVTSRSGIFLWNQTAGVNIETVTRKEGESNNYASSTLVGKFSLTVPSIIIMQYRTELTRATDGLGQAGDLGENQTFGYVRIRKVA